MSNEFTLACKKLHILLVGRAIDWYWRFRKEHSNVHCIDFCKALKEQ